MDDMELAVMPFFMSRELDTKLHTQTPGPQEILDNFIINLLQAGANKASTILGAAALESLPQLIAETDTVKHILKVGPALYTQLNHLEQTLCKKRSVLIQHFITEALKQEQAAIPA